MQVKLSEQEINSLKQAKDGILKGPRWQFTSEGYVYWSQVVCKLYSKIEHGTSDGKPWQEPVDEPIVTPFDECKCDMRTRLVGDGCEVCNPELAKELARPDAVVHQRCKEPVSDQNPVASHVDLPESVLRLVAIGLLVEDRAKSMGFEFIDKQLSLEKAGRHVFQLVSQSNAAAFNPEEQPRPTRPSQVTPINPQ